MTSHEVARLLLSLPELPIAVHAGGHTFAVPYDCYSHGPLRIGIAHLGHQGSHVIIGSMFNAELERGDWRVTSLVTGHIDFSVRKVWRNGVERYDEVQFGP